MFIPGDRVQIFSFPSSLEQGSDGPVSSSLGLLVLWAPGNAHLPPLPSPGQSLQLLVPLQGQCGSEVSVSIRTVVLSHQELAKQSDMLGWLLPQHFAPCYYQRDLVAPSLSASQFWIHLSTGLISKWVCDRGEKSGSSQSHCHSPSGSKLSGWGTRVSPCRARPRAQKSSTQNTCCYYYLL